MAQIEALPSKTREQQWAVWDSTRLNDFPFRADDILICTWSKSGTTWVQQLLAQLVFQGDPEAYGQQLSPWIEFRALSKEQWFAIAGAQTHRRFLKSHSPLAAIPFRPEMKYLYVARDVRDVIFSLYHHHSSFTPGAYEVFNNAPGRVGGPLEPHGCDVRTYYNTFLDEGRLPGFGVDHDFWDHVKGFWDARRQPNLLLVHYARLKADFLGEARRIAGFLGIEAPERSWPAIAANCGIEHMRGLASRFGQLDQIFEGGGNTFINQGVNGRWKDVLSAEEIAKADRVAAERLPADCAHWLKTGELPEDVA